MDEPIIWTCPACQTVNGDQEACAVCDTPRAASPPTERVPAVPVVTAPFISPNPRANDAPPGTGAPAPGQEPTGAAAAAAPASKRGLLLVALAVLIVVAVSAAFVLGSRTGDEPEAAERTSADRDGDDAAATTTEAPATTTTAKSAPTTSLPDAPVLSTAAPGTVPPGSSSSPGGTVPAGGRTWTAMRSSLPDEASARALAAEIGGYAFRSDEYASLRSGLWVVAVGSYATAEDALDYCRQNGLYDADDCVALPLSQDPADISTRPHL